MHEELERAIIGTMLEGGLTAIEKISGRLKKEDFLLPTYRDIYVLLLKYAQEKRPVNVVIFHQDNPQYKIASLVEKSIWGTKDLINEYVRRIKQKRINTELKNILINNNTTEKIFSSIEKLKNEYKSNDVFDIKALSKMAVNEIERQKGRDREFPTGLIDFDDMFGGLHREDLFILAGETSSGKCFGKGTEVLMYNGTTKKVEDIRVGDRVMGNDSTPRTVLGLGRGKEELYKIQNEDGSFYVVNKSHILSLQRTKSGGRRCNNPLKEKRLKKNRIREIKNISVKEYLSRDKTFKHFWRGYKEAVKFKPHPTKIPPYLLGLWLGNGSASKPNIMTADKEIVDYLYKIAKIMDWNVKKFRQKNNKPDVYSFTKKQQNGGFVKLLKKYNLFNNKHIPFCYKVNSKKKRMELFAGLIDSDDSNNSSTGMGFTNENKKLCDDVVFLARSLGFYASCRVKHINHMGEQRKYYRCYIGGEIKKIPLLLAYKKKIGQGCERRTWLGQNIKVTPLGVGEYYGFELDGNGLFLLGNFTVTHNTSLLINIFWHLAKLGKKVLLCTLEMSPSENLKRIASLISGVTYQEFRNGNLSDAEWSNIVNAFNDISQTKLIIEETYTTEQVNEMVARYSPDILFVDYIQQFQDNGGKSRNEFIGSICSSLKTIARFEKIPVVAISQLNRAIQYRGEKSRKPILSDLRDSGSIEIDADQVAFISWPWRADRTESEHKLVFNLAKNRHGQIGEINLHFKKETMKIYNWSKWRSEQTI